LQWEHDFVAVGARLRIAADARARACELARALQRLQMLLMKLLVNQWCFSNHER